MTARVGKRGHVHFRGTMPMQPEQSQGHTAGDAAPEEDSEAQRQAEDHTLALDLQGLEVRVRNVYTGEPAKRRQIA